MAPAYWVGRGPDRAIARGVIAIPRGVIRKNSRMICAKCCAPLRSMATNRAEKVSRAETGRGRDGHCWPPRAQIRTGGITAYGSYRG